MPKIVKNEPWVKDLRKQVKELTDNIFYLSNDRGKMRLEYKDRSDRQSCHLPFKWDQDYVTDVLNLIVGIYNHFEYGKGTKRLNEALVTVKSQIIKTKQNFTARELDLIYDGLKEKLYKLETTAFGDEFSIEEDMAELHILMGKVLKTKIY
tara:strand:- start:278 stop:730 length:453 start_codon:yes stop_codon:yes gene_type:complete